MVLGTRAARRKKIRPAKTPRKKALTPDSFFSTDPMEERGGRKASGSPYDRPAAEMQALYVRPPWADLLLTGKKAWEIRSRRTYKRGTMAIVESGTREISGTCDLANSIELLPTDFLLASDKHLIGKADAQKMMYDGLHAWVVENPVRFARPVPFTPPRGAVIWSTLPPNVVKLVREEMARSGGKTARPLVSVH